MLGLQSKATARTGCLREAAVPKAPGICSGCSHSGRAMHVPAAQPWAVAPQRASAISKIACPRRTSLRRAAAAADAATTSTEGACQGASNATVAALPIVIAQISALPRTVATVACIATLAHC